MIWLTIITICLGMTVCSSCSTGIPVNDIEGTIGEVIDGATIKLSNGLVVHINGLRSDNSFTREQLQKYVGENVSLMSDSEGIPRAETYDDTVEAYVHVIGTGEDLALELLKLAGREAFYSLNCSDRREQYEEAVKTDMQNTLTWEQLCARATAASMLVSVDGKKGSWIGTAFFIGKDGLALTNNHVLNTQENAYVYLSNSHGDMDFQQRYKICRIVYSDPTYDFTIFYVDLDPTTVQRIVHLPLAKDERSFARGAELGCIGNPAPGQEILTMSFASGTVAAIRSNEGRIQMNVPITNGFSGGPAVNRRGEVLGISVSGYANNNANLNFAVDARLVRKKLNELNLPYGGK